MNRGTAKRPRRFSRGYSLVEIIISMALIILLSAAGFATCYASIAVQRNSRNHIYIWSAIDAFRSCLETTLAAADLSSAQEDKLTAVQTIVQAYDARLVFALNTPALPTQNFEGSYALTGAGWTVTVAAQTRTEQEPVLDADGNPVLDENGNFAVEETVTVLRGLELSYAGAADGVPSYLFTYRYFPEEIAVTATLDMSGENYTLTAEGRRASSDRVVYSIEEVYGA